MRRCKKCVMPDTRPGIKFNADGVCFPCLAAEEAESTNWFERLAQFLDLCRKHRGTNGNGYDCIVAASGGKDSHVQVHWAKEIGKLNPLLVSVDNLSWTQTGRDNFFNIRDRFDCSCISLNLSPYTTRRMVRYCFEKYGKPWWYWDRAVYVYPIRMAIKMGIKLVIYGENVSHQYGGVMSEETPYAFGQIDNDVASEIDINELKEATGFSGKQLHWLEYPSDEDIMAMNIEPIYLSYYKRWGITKHVEKAKKFGFKELRQEWNRQGYIEDYDQIDSVGYLLHAWMKYPKYGHQRVTDVASSLIREGKLTREWAMKLVEKYDHCLDPKILDDFLSFTGYTLKEFTDILERWWNPELFVKENGRWFLL